eukprot:TRINITY_DN8547_c0_g1_i2.p1 TRINITY_DN8547_c0_g1~~TRINITY_DN8547_c0_g1_i2.p1  ORF type:complete len:333 (+),score=41.31 TRINITY_DN8547_c0_g1_i2:148-999(+)
MEDTLTTEMLAILIEMTQEQVQIFLKQNQQQSEINIKNIKLEQEFGALVEVGVVQPFLKNCKQWETEINQIIQKGWKEFMDDLEKLKKEVQESRQESIGKLQTIEEGFGTQLDDFLESFDYNLQQSAYKGSRIEDLIPAKEDPQVVIQALLEADQIDDAFRQCLTQKDAQILSWMLAKLSPEQTLSTLQLTQPVLIGLVLQISMFLETQDDWSIFLKWLQEALLLLDENDNQLGDYMKKYLEDAHETLQQSPKENLSMEHHRDVLLSLHLMNSKLRSLDKGQQ